MLHAPGNAAPLLQLRTTVVTVHDTMLWDRPEEAGLPRRFLHEVLPRALRAARRIITISRHSMGDIVRRFPFARGKIRVIPHGLDERFASPADPRAVQALRDKLGLRRPYVLYVGGWAPRKRADWAVRLLERWAARPAGRELELAMIGFAGQPADAVLEVARRAGLAERVRLLPYLSADELPLAYAGCEFVLYPTLYEGFGFPALEAQAAGKVVLMGRTSSLVELAGPAAGLLDGEDFDAWVAAGLRWLEHPADAAALAEASRQWARQFRWSAAAKATYGVYREALGWA